MGDYEVEDAQSLSEQFKDTQAQFSAMQEKIEKIERQAESLKGMAGREHERNLKAAETRMRMAVEDGDIEAFEEAKAEADRLMAQVPDDKSPQVDQTVTDKWVAANRWYKENPRMAKFAFECGEYLSKTKPNLTQKQQLSEIRSMVEEEFPDYFSNPDRERPSTVESAHRGRTANRKGGKRSYSNLPSEAQEHCDRFCAEIPGFTKEKYLETYSGPWRK
jgi:hypothetical protein